ATEKRDITIGYRLSRVQTLTRVSSTRDRLATFLAALTLASVQALTTTSASAQPPEPGNAVSSPASEESSTLLIHPVSRAPSLDDMDRGSPPDAGLRTDFRQNQPGDGIAASRSTAAYVSYDADNLYVMFDCSDDREQVRAHLAKRENIGDDDRVFVY